LLRGTTFNSCVARPCPKPDFTVSESALLLNFLGW
jgi:hypothetical protein